MTNFNSCIRWQTFSEHDFVVSDFFGFSVGDPHSWYLRDSLTQQPPAISCFNVWMILNIEDIATRYARYTLELL